MGKNSNTRNGFSLKRKRDIYIKSGGFCGICGFPVSFDKMTIDHIMPISLGGSRRKLDNQQASHAKCNHRKGNKYKQRVAKVIKRRDSHGREIDRYVCYTR